MKTKCGKLYNSAPPRLRFVRTLLTCKSRTEPGPASHVVALVCPRWPEASGWEGRGGPGPTCVKNRFRRFRLCWPEELLSCGHLSDRAEFPPPSFSTKILPPPTQLFTLPLASDLIQVSIYLFLPLQTKCLSIYLSVYLYAKT